MGDLRCAAGLLLLGALIFPAISGLGYFLPDFPEPGFVTALLADSDSGARRGAAPLFMSGLVFLAGALYSVSGRSPRRPLRPLFLLAAAAMALSLVSSLTSSHRMDAMLTWLPWAAAMLAFLLSCELGSRVQPRPLLWILYATVLAVLPAAYASMTDGTAIVQWRAQGSFFLPSLLAAYLVMFLPVIAAAFMLDREGTGWELCWGLLGGLALGAMIFSFSRLATLLALLGSAAAIVLHAPLSPRRLAVLGAGSLVLLGLLIGARANLGAAGLMATAGVGLTLLTAAALKFAFPRPRRAIAKLFLLAAASVVWIWLVQPQPGWVLQETESRAARFSQGDGSTAARLLFWKAAALMTAEHPFLGVGPDGFRRYYPRYQGSFEFYSISPHNFPLIVASECGLPALLCVLGLIGWGAYQAFGSLQGLSPGVERAVRTGCLAGSGAFLVLHLAELGWHFPGLVITLALLAGVSVGRSFPADEVESRSAWRVGAGLMAAALAGVSFYGMFPLYHLEQGKVAEEAGQRVTAVRHYQTAAGMIPSWGRAHRLAASVLLQEQGVEEEALARHVRVAEATDPLDAWSPALLGQVLLREGQPEQALAAFERSLALDPYNYPSTYYHAAVASSALGRAAEARAFLDKAVSMYPIDRLDVAYAARAPEIKMQLALVYTALGEVTGPTTSPRRAEAYFLRALQLEPRSLRARMGLGTSVMVQGRPAEAAALFEEVLRRQPDSPSVKRMLAQCYRALGGQP